MTLLHEVRCFARLAEARRLEVPPGVDGERLVEHGHLEVVRAEARASVQLAVAGDARIEDGEIIVALINNEEAAVKRFFLKKNRIELHPENRAYKTVKYGFREVMIQGKVVGVRRGPETFYGLLFFLAETLF